LATTGTTGNANLEFVSASNPDMAGGSFLVQVLKAAERAQVAGASLIDPINGLAANETLTFTVDDVNLHINLLAGDSLEAIIEKINDEMVDEGTGIVAFDDGGKLGLRTEGYGSNATITVKSNTDAAGQTGIGTAGLTDTGLDVAGTINGIVAKGSGQILTGPKGSAIDGLNIRVLSSATGNAGSINVTFGVAELLSRALGRITDGETGIIKVRTDGLNGTIEDINERIEKMQGRIDSAAERLRAQFRAMETQLASLQSQGTFLANSLASIAQIGQRS
jgi:flagellar hook-associated protein 2